MKKAYRIPAAADANESPDDLAQGDGPDPRA